MMEGVLHHMQTVEINRSMWTATDKVRWPLRSVMCWGSICTRRSDNPTETVCVKRKIHRCTRILRRF